MRGTVLGEHLYGASNGDNSLVTAPVKNAHLDAWIELVETSSPHQSCYQDFTFGIEDESPPVVRRRVTGVLQSDREGRVHIDSNIASIPASSRPRAIKPILYLLDEAGVMARMQSTTATVLREDKHWVGVRTDSSPVSYTHLTLPTILLV